VLVAPGGFYYARVSFTDVDGNTFNLVYNDQYDLESLLDAVNCRITDSDNYPVVKGNKYEGINGNVELSKPIIIQICLE